MDQLSVIKWTIMEKGKFGLHSLNAEKKKSFPTAALLGTACCRRRRTVVLLFVVVDECTFGESALPEQQHHMFA